MGTHQGPLHHQHELHLRQGDGDSCNHGDFDQFNLANNYGVQSGNRTHIFNAAYSIELGNPVSNKRLPAASSTAGNSPASRRLESGPNLTGIQNQNFGMNLNGYKIPGSISAQNPTGINVSNVSLLGTTDIQLNPMLTCNPGVGPGNEPVHQPELFRHPDGHRPERPEHPSGDLRTGFLQLRPGTLQELPDQRVEETADPLQWNQLPEPSAVVVQRQQPESRFRWHYRQGQHATVRHRHRKAGPSHHPAGGQVLLLIAAGCNLIHRADVSREASALSFCRGLT